MTKTYYKKTSLFYYRLTINFPQSFYELTSAYHTLFVSIIICSNNVNTNNSRGGFEDFNFTANFLLLDCSCNIIIPSSLSRDQPSIYEEQKKTAKTGTAACPVYFFFLYHGFYNKCTKPLLYGTHSSLTAATSLTSITIP